MLLTYRINNVIIVSNDTLFGGFMSKKIDRTDFKKEILPFISKLFLFKGLSDEGLKDLYPTLNFEIYEFEANENIYTPTGFSKKIGFIISGECLVEKIKADNGTVPLNKLIAGDSFGIITVFSEAERFPTLVKAKKKTKVMFFDGSEIISLCERYSEISLAVIRFLSNRIEFLNKKIATFSADSVEEKFAFFLLEEAKRYASETFALNLSKTAKVLNAGRASVYRAIEALEKLSLIKFENKKIYISDLKGLERITQ